VEELEVICENLKAVELDPRKKEAVIGLIASNLVKYSKQLNQKSQPIPQKVPYLGGAKWRRTVLLNSSISLGLAGGALLTTQNFFLSSVALGIPWIVKGMKSLKYSWDHWRFHRPKAPYVPQLGYLEEETLVTEEPVTTQVSLDELSQFKPELDLTSVSSIEHYGTEIEHGVRILGTITGQFRNIRGKNKPRTALLKALNAMMEVKDLSWTTINEHIGTPILGYQDQIAREQTEAQSILAHLDKFISLFNDHIQVLEQKKEEYIKNHNVDGKDVDYLLVSLTLKSVELSDFKSSLEQMRAIPLTLQDTNSSIRGLLTKQVNKIAVRVSLPYQVADAEDLKPFHQLIEYLNQD
jgi:hypothetical protein